MKILKRILLISLLLIIAYALFYVWRAFPIISGYGAKNMCSCVMLAQRNAEDVIKNELGKFPLHLGSFSVNFNDSSTTGTVFGLAKRKAIYRKGLGCTLIAEMDEEDLRNQKINIPAPPRVNQDTVAWPTGNLIMDSINESTKHETLEAVLETAFAEPGPKKLRRTRAVIVVHNGKIIAERYAPGFTTESKLIGWSMTKSITNALVGILVKQGKLDVNEPAPVGEWKNDDRNRITLNDLMHASSGLKWEENYSGPSGATNMLFKKKAMGTYAADVPLANEPGKVFYYSSGTTNIISRIVRDAIGDQNYYQFPYTELFYKIGMFNTTLEPDASGTFVGSSYSFGTARDWARFGLLYLNDGVWNGERILPEGWVKYTTTPARGADRGQYGAQFWLNAGAPGKPELRYYPSVPTDLYWADGFEGQNVFILPSKKLVVVKLSLSQGNYLDDNEFLAKIINALPNSQTSIENQEY
ncbi:serine hydrolase domain-containing protein [Chryseosolibacter indicus]|uniref:Beta-lactamase family protein n=1 Tax=Chryseosolibacter indicus TaxID=2782351 RepID=A0ABS5VUX6_9BACT|nr:serine hydrolase [Chryseosolibacter indicus]MBT1705228.1 beta-lactamase family protein [Chryseosolibacter indicus]